jgi:N-acyl-D-amino-acid deacylase
MGRDLDIIIKNALIYDGSGKEPFSASVGLGDGTIAYIGVDPPMSGLLIDADGMVLCPGFIDTHGHSEYTVIAAPGGESKILQGITTEINGNCGLSAAPLMGDAKARREDEFRELALEERWETFDDYFTLLKRKSPVINFATLTGHGNVRASIMGYKDSVAADDDISKMASLIEDSLSSGSFGFSTGLIYPPGVFTGTEEIIRLLKSVRRDKGLVYATHMRSEGDSLIESLEEAITIGSEGGLKVHLSHLKTAGKANWHKIDEAIRIVESAYDRGIPITFDRYPYTAASTDLDTLLPSWAYEGGNEREYRRLTDQETRKELIGSLRSRHDRTYYRSVFVSSVITEKNKWVEGKSILEIAETLHVAPEDAVLDLLIDERIRVGAIFESMSEDNLLRFLSHPLCMVGSDSSMRSFRGITASGKPHPRAFGTFPRYIGRYVLGKGLMPLEKGIRRITLLPSQTFGIDRRGLVKEGYHADLVIFDPGAIMDRATYGDPFEKPAGIRHVIVNGKVAVSEGEVVNGVRSGRILRCNAP